ncbi:MAG: hypothetical protein ACRCVW_02120 [Brevinema sp.]
MKIVFWSVLMAIIGIIPTHPTQTTTPSPYVVRISFLKQNYLSNESIDICLKIMNTNDYPITFSVADSNDEFLWYQSIDFELRTSQNITVPLKNIVQAQIKLKAADPSLYRDITLLKNESFTKVFNIRDFYDITDAKTFYIQASFYPDPDNHNTMYQSYFASFSQSAQAIVEQKIVEDDLLEQATINGLAQLLPNEIIESFFDAQKQKNWQLFLLHIDPERLIYSFPNFATQYDQATTGSFKLNIIDQFKRFFTSHWNIPLTSYHITETVIKDDTATVTVNAVESIRFTNRRLRYTFTLYRTGQNTWLISDYLVLSLN